MTTTTRRRSRNPSRKPSDQLLITSSTNEITELETISYNRQVTIVYLDQLPWRTTATRVVKALKLEVGERCQSAILSRRILEEEKRLAMDLALQLLSYRGRSRREVVEKLEKRRLSPEAVEATLIKLEQAGYLNDHLFAKTWVNERIEIRGYGRQRIKSELISKGIDATIINSEIERVYTPEKEKQAAMQLARQRLPRYAGLEKVVIRRRLIQAMMRRGFSAQIAQHAAREAMA